MPKTIRCCILDPQLGRNWPLGARRCYIHLGALLAPPAGSSAVLHARHVICGRLAYRAILPQPRLARLVLVIVVVVGAVVPGAAAGPALRGDPPIILPLDWGKKGTEVL